MSALSTADLIEQNDKAQNEATRHASLAVEPSLRRSN